jgi:hypothetical protein
MWNYAFKIWVSKNNRYVYSLIWYPLFISEMTILLLLLFNCSDLIEKFDIGVVGMLNIQVLLQKCCKSGSYQAHQFLKVFLFYFVYDFCADHFTFNIFRYFVFMKVIWVFAQATSFIFCISSFTSRIVKGNFPSLSRFEIDRCCLICVFWDRVWFSFVISIFIWNFFLLIFFLFNIHL